MTKKNALILIVLIFLLLGGGLYTYYFFVVQNQPTGVAGETRSFSDFFPFGKSEPKKVTPEENTEGGNAVVPEVQQPIVSIPKIRQVSKDPVAGATVFDRTIEIITDGVKEKFNKTFIRFVDRGTGHISETSTDSLNLRRLSNTTMPKIYEAVWGSRDTVLLRYLSDNDEIRTYSAQVKEASTTDPTQLPPLNGLFLPDRISAISFSPKSDKIFYMNGFTNATGIVSKPNGTSKTEIYSSPFTEWTLEWPTESVVTLTTKAAAAMNGYMYFVNSKTGSVSKILSNIRGLTTKVNPTGTHILYGQGGRQPLMSAYDVQKQTAVLVKKSTLPEKCVWSVINPKQAYCAMPAVFTAGDYPEDWYKGLVTFDDSIWKVDATTGEATKIFDPVATGDEKFDAIELHLNGKEDTLIFTNKKDYTLWSLNLSKE